MIGRGHIELLVIDTNTTEMIEIDITRDETKNTLLTYNYHWPGWRSDLGTSDCFLSALVQSCILELVEKLYFNRLTLIGRNHENRW